MEGIDVQHFIASQRAKLSQEKARLGDGWTPRGILPSGKRSLEKASRLRQERANEYQDFLKTEERTHSVRGKSVAEIRREMANNRQQELETGQNGSKTNTAALSRRGGGYGSLREQRLAEERRYRGEVIGDDVITQGSRRRWEESGYHESNYNPVTNRAPPSQRWDDEEQELMKWACNQGRSNSSKTQQNRAPTPPTYESPWKHKTLTSDHSSMRSISAPVVGGGIAGIGMTGEDPQAKRDRQRRYAEELRAQMKEKSEASKRDKIGSQGKSRRSESPEPRARSSPTRHYAIEKESYDPRLNVHRNTDDREHTRRLPRSPHRERQDRYAPYPPPHFPEYPGYMMPGGPYPHWIPPSYYPPRAAYPHHDQPPDEDYRHHPPHHYGNPYYPPYPHPSALHNPYLPSQGPPPHRGRWDEDVRLPERKTRDGDERDYKKVLRFEKENVSPLRYRDQHGDDEHTSPLTGGGGHVTKENKASYRAELERQMREKKERDLKAKIEKERYELKKENEIYDPFGKGGCGAPVRDQHGNLVADLKHMRQINEGKLNARTTSSLGQIQNDDKRPGSVVESPQHSPSTVLTYDKVDESVQKKSNQESYRDYLKRQVQEKEEMKQLEKQRKMMEEQKELERLEKERKKMEEDYKLEMERQRQRNEEAQRKNEALKREAEEKRREAALKFEEEQRKLAEERHIGALMEPPPIPQQRSRSPPVPALRKKMNPFGDPPLVTEHSQGNVYRSSSPPVPTLQHQLQQDNQEDQHHQQQHQAHGDSTVVVETLSRSPPVPAVQHRLQSQDEQQHVSEVRQHNPVAVSPPIPALQSSNRPPVHSRENIPPVQLRGDEEYSQSRGNETTPTERLPPDVLSQLAAIRIHLQSQLMKQHQHSTQHPRPDHSGQIFDRVRQQKPKLVAPRVRRPRDSALSSAVNEFNNLKYCQNPHRREFLDDFPEPPQSGSALDLQQDALVRHQEQRLTRMRQQGGDHTQTRPPQDLLSSETQHFPLGRNPFQDEDGVVGFSLGEDHQHHSRAPASLRGRRRQWDRGPSPGGQSHFSVITYEVENMAVKNEERRRRLDAILNAAGPSRGQGHGVQAASDGDRDPEAVLNRFLQESSDDRMRSVSRQSEGSLECETLQIATTQP